MSTLVYVHASQSAEAQVTEELVTLAAALDGTATVLASGAAAAQVAEIAASHGAASVTIVRSEIERWQSDLAADAVSAAFRDVGALLLVCAARRFERDVAALVSASAGLRLLSACVGGGAGWLRFETPSGDVGLALEGLGPAAVLVVPWSVEPMPSGRECQTTERESAPADRYPSSRVPADEVRDCELLPLDRSAAVVAGGRGLLKADNLRLLDELAALIPGASVGVTAPLVTDGWAPKSMLVGKTGARIAPHVYIAAGISGSFFHESNTRASDYVLTINRDPDAQLPARADFSLVGDACELLAELTRAIAANHAGG
ncbi:MAG TPA: FAD-binding protein [Solirubrobacteraceae bacterium]|nr:FAD-binding protein [Solirubrobacteraceae bacterium]